MTLITQALAKIAEMEERADAATLWTPAECNIQADPEDGYVFVPECSTLGDTLIQQGGHYEGYNNDWVFCAHSRADLPALCALAKALLSEGVGLNGWNGYPATEAALKAFVEGK